MTRRVIGSHRAMMANWIEGIEGGRVGSGSQCDVLAIPSLWIWWFPSSLGVARFITSALTTSVVTTPLWWLN